MQVIKALGILIMMLFSTATFACTCFSKKMRSQEELKSFDYIAHLKIVDVMPHPSAENLYNFSFELIEKVVGEEVNILTVQSYHPDFQKGATKTSSSCDFLVRQGQEYLILANEEDGDLSAGFCTIINMHIGGAEDHGYNSSFALLYSARQAFNRYPKSEVDNGTVINFYENGKKKSKINYKNGWQNGKLIRWRPDGKKYLVEQYRAGKLHGKQKRKYVNENYVLRYNLGKRIGSSFFYGRKKKELYKKVIHNDEGILIEELQYDENRKVRSQLLFDTEIKLTTMIYFQDGEMLAKHTKNEITGEETHWER